MHQKDSSSGGRRYDAHTLFMDMTDLVNTFVRTNDTEEDLEVLLRDVKAAVVLLKDRVDEKFNDVRYGVSKEPESEKQWKMKPSQPSSKTQIH